MLKSLTISEKAYHKMLDLRLNANVLAYLIFKNHEHVGTVRIHIGQIPGDIGAMDVLVMDLKRARGEQWQHAVARGKVDYLKISEAMSGFTIAGFEFGGCHEWQTQLRAAGFDVMVAI